MNPWLFQKKAVIYGSQKWNFYPQREEVQEKIKLEMNISTVAEKKVWKKEEKGWRVSVERRIQVGYV